ncbi:MAG: PrsW family intramembrane metalloprotease [Actinomycetota bacterium]|nr:PrsW family intramembrane metalloprotease [Actinomycetota bacterium]
MSEHTNETVACPSCGQQVPGGNFCIRCGANLAEGGRRGFAAAPNERRLLPATISTLFPQLTRGSMIGFRVALAAGIALVVALELLRLFPLALAAAAVLVPLLVVIYLYDVDEYEDEPLRVVALTVLWGAAAGVAVGLLGRYISPSHLGPVAESTQKRLFVRGLGLPLLATALMLAGPLILLPYRKFNDTLDGATFGAACAVTFVGAQVLAQSTDLFSAGFRPEGLVYPRIVYLLEFAVAMPVLAAGAIGSAAGALWLRYRAPARDRAALGWLGDPFFASLAAAALMVAASFVLLYVPWRTAALVLLLVLAAIALVWLRQVIHVGLIQEASEIEVGPEITCANCHHTTPQHSFCINCGISLRALPKVAPKRAVKPATPKEGTA